MFSRIRKRLTFANIAMTLALVLAMSGGAYAAGKYVITSTRQIKPSVLAQLKGKNGANGTNGSNGTNGAQGPQGPQGPQGSQGEKGVAGTNGEDGKVGPKGATGPAGPTGPEGICSTSNCVLPNGATEKGVWSAIALPVGYNSQEVVSAPISFSVPLANELVVNEAEPEKNHVHILNEAEKGEGKFEAGVAGKDGLATGCPTTSEANKPEAEPGNLCVFVTFVNANVEKIQPLSQTTEFEGAGPWGSILLVHAIKAGEKVDTYGTWAVTG